MVDGESCYSICDQGFRLEENNVKFSRFTCSCTGPIQEAECLWRQRNSFVQMAERKLSKRMMENDIALSSVAADDQWDMSIHFHNS